MNEMKDNEINMTQNIEEGFNIDAPPSVKEKKGLKETLDSYPLWMKLTIVAIVAIAVVAIIFNIIKPSHSSKSESAVAANTSTFEDNMREEKEEYPSSITKQEKKRLLTDEEMGMPDPNSLSNVKPVPNTPSTFPPQYAAPARPVSYQGASAAEYKPAEYRPSRTLQRRMSKTYQQALDFYGSPQVVYSSEDPNIEAKGNPIATVNKGLKDLYEDAGADYAGKNRYYPAGTEFRAVLNENINTDYPSIVKATVIAPQELIGAEMLVSYSLAQDRISATVNKLIIPAKGSARPQEVAVAGVVRDGLPGIGGRVNHHWGAQMAAGIANAGLTAGALAYAAQNSGNDNLGNAVVVSPVVEQGMAGVLKPVNYLGRQRPPTVKAKAGREFSILLTSGVEITL